MKTWHDIPVVTEGLLPTPFYPRIVEENWNSCWSDWNGYATVGSFKDEYVEYYSIRNTCGVFDVSAMIKYRIRGNDAAAMLDRMMVRYVHKQPIGTVFYNVWCTDRGRIIDDGTVFRFAEDDFRIYCAEPNLDWLLLNAEGFEDVEISEETAGVCGLALQGPTSFALLEACGFEGIDTLKQFELDEFDLPGSNGEKEVMISRTGFTGDLGYELWTSPENAIALWDLLFSKRDLYGLHPFGEDALNTARIEAGLILPEIEFHGSLHTTLHNHDTTPFEMGLGWMVKFDKLHFNGRDALLKEKEQGPAWRLLRLDVQGEKVAESAIIYADEACEKEIGYVTSAVNSPATKKNIALAMIKGEYASGPIFAEVYHQKELRWYRKVAPCVIRKGPFWSHPRAKASPPGRF